MDENMNNNFNNENNNITPPQVTPAIPGRGKAIASLVLGILSIVCWFFAVSSIVSIIFGIIGLILSSSAKKDGYQGGIKTGGFVTSLIGLIGGAIIFVACVACVGCVGAAAAAEGLDLDELADMMNAFN